MRVGTPVSQRRQYYLLKVVSHEQCHEDKNVHYVTSRRYVTEKLYTLLRKITLKLCGDEKASLIDICQCGMSIFGLGA